MESRYGIGINNRYALFIDEEGEENEDLLVTKAAKAAKAAQDQKKVMAATVAKPEPKPAEIKPKPAVNNRNNKVQEKNDRNREGDKENRGNRFEGKRVLDSRKSQESRGEKDNQGPRPERRAPRGGLEDGGEGRRGPRPGGSGRGGREGGARGARGGGSDRGGRGGGRGGKREFERKSGDERTGVKSVDKREGGGAHNWGTYEDDIKAEEDKNNLSTDGEGNPAEQKSHANNADQNDESRTEAEPKEEEPKTLTLDEWKAQQGRKEGPKFNVRKAGEGSDIDPKWKKTTAYRKEKEQEDEEEEENAELYPQRVNRQKRVLDIQFNFADASRNGPAPGGRGGRGGRGGGGERRGGPGGGGGEERGERRERGPGGQGRGGERKPMRGAGGPGPKPARGGRGAEAPNVNDEASFPSLG